MPPRTIARREVTDLEDALKRFRLWALYAKAFQPRLLARFWSFDAQAGTRCICVHCGQVGGPSWGHLTVFLPPGPQQAAVKARGLRALFKLAPAAGECWWALCLPCRAIATPALEAECLAKVARIVEELLVKYPTPAKNQARFWRRALFGES